LPDLWNVAAGTRQTMGLLRKYLGRDKLANERRGIVSERIIPYTAEKKKKERGVGSPLEQIKIDWAWLDAKDESQDRAGRRKGKKCQNKNEQPPYASQRPD